MSHILMILLSDGLRQPSGALAEAPYRQLIYCRVPEDWVEGEIPASDDLWLKGPTLREEKLELLLEAFYGAGWRRGNSDGSRYEVLGLGTRLLNPAMASERPWEGGDSRNETLRYQHYAVNAEGQLKRVLPSGL